ncbi:MAG: hypothetical protein ABIW30_06475 [Arenimonas sp.]
MRHPAPTPSGSPLPLSRLRADHVAAHAGPVQLASEDIEKFNNLVHELYQDAPRVDAGAIASVASWLESQPIEQRELLLQARLGRLAELNAMRADPDWPLDPAQAHRIEMITDYVTSENDLIPDATPTYGHLDDALLLELAWPMLAEDVDDYRDFCHFRDEQGARFARPLHQLDWMNARAEEGALWEHLHRVHEQHYVEHGAPDGIFRVS